MSLTVVGSLAFDAVETPFGKRDRMLGGAATHFALAASFFDEVHVVGPVGDDFGDEEMAILATRGTDVSDVARVPGGQRSRPSGACGVARRSSGPAATRTTSTCARRSTRG